jgi:hypothetical protein
MEYCKIPKNILYVSKNAVNPERFNFKVEKVPYRFIYSSCPRRGLDTLINIFPRIKKEHPESSLYLFVKKEDINVETFEKIKKMD